MYKFPSNFWFVVNENGLHRYMESIVEYCAPPSKVCFSVYDQEDIGDLLEKWYQTPLISTKAKQFAFSVSMNNRGVDPYRISTPFGYIVSLR